MRLRRPTGGVDHFLVSVQWPERLSIRPLSAGDAKVIAEWWYDGPWHIYDYQAGDEEPVPGDGYRLSCPRSTVHRSASIVSAELRGCLDSMPTTPC
jgi:hypothetical protein